VARIIVLDASPLGLLAHARQTEPAVRCRAWFERVRDSGSVFVIPEIADYEVRRKLQHWRLHRAIGRLDELANDLTYIPITTETMRRAAELWGRARREGSPTAPPDALDSDVILAAQAELIADDPRAVVVATSNVRHISRFVAAEFWADIDGT
jgi:predicted nucleic acid-binding protein